MFPNRRFPIGAEVVEGGVHFRIWAPSSSRLFLQLEGENYELEREADGYFSLLVKEARPTMRYGFQFENEEKLFADPASRFQPDGPEGLSEIIDPGAFKWGDESWPGISSPTGHIIYELHIGTFTEKGSWEAAQEKLMELKELGITLIEMMPIGDFMGSFGWGYDCVNLFSPTHLYGRPDDLRRFVDCAHGLGLGVILDVVYNHFGPSGNYIERFSPEFFSSKYKNEWGKAINFGSREVRQFFTANSSYWIAEYHFDGLRLDAIHSISDPSSPHIVAEIVEKTKQSAPKPILIFAENESQEAHVLESRENGGFEIDAAWNDDFHHSALVKLTGRREGYYKDYLGTNQELISALKYGYLYQGQYYSWQKKRRGTPNLKNAYNRYVHYLENHDQIANAFHGMRLSELTSPSSQRMMMLLLILAPQTPLLFQGQEFACSTPFVYFADHEPSLARLVWEGRKKFLHQFPSFQTTSQQSYADPGDAATFHKCKINWEEKKDGSRSQFFAFTRDLIQLKKGDPTLLSPLAIDGAEIDDNIFIIRYFGEDGDRLLLFNFGSDSLAESYPEPLVAPPQESEWKLMLSSEEFKYGGIGIPEQDERWKAPGDAALVFKSEPL